MHTRAAQGKHGQGGVSVKDIEDDDKKTDWYIGRYLDSQIPNDFKQDGSAGETAFALACIAAVLIIGAATVLMNYM